MKNLLKFISIFILFNSIFASLLSAEESFIPKPPSLNATNYILIDSVSGRVLAENGSDERIEPASITKVMTGFVAADQIAKGFVSLEDEVLISENCWRKGGSKMFIREGTRVLLSDLIKGMGSRCFDSEGVKTDTLKLVSNGILNNYLVDTYNGKKLNLKSNGRSGGSTNLYFENGNINYDDLLKSHSKILYVTETIGHGTNLVTGDYSVGANGFLIENGEFKYPVNEITIAGNLDEMFKNIILANDLEFKYSVNSPTMMIDGMTVAGK